MANAANLVILTGRLTGDPEVKTGNNGKNFATASIAVQRNYKNKNGEYEADFFNLLFGGNQTEFLQKYFHKGSPISVVGSLTTSHREVEGKKMTFTNVNVDSVNFVPGASKTEGTSAPAGQPTQQNANGQQSFSPLPSDGYAFGEGNDDSLPF